MEFVQGPWQVRDSTLEGIFLSLVSLVGNRTRSVWIRTAGIGLISRRVAVRSYTQPTCHGKHRLITVGGCCLTIRTSAGRLEGDRKCGKCRAARSYKGV